MTALLQSFHERASAYFSAAAAVHSVVRQARVSVVRMVVLGMMALPIFGLTQVNAQDAGAEFEGNGAVGACYYPDETCTIVSLPECESSGGAFMGDVNQDGNIDSADCPASTGIIEGTADAAGDQQFSEYCGFDKVKEILAQTDPNWHFNLDELEQHIRNSQGVAENALPPTFTIPVVVHVLHRTTDTYGTGFNISYDQIKWQIQALNAAFQRNYPAYNGQSHGSSAANAQIQFCLATIPAPSSVSWATNPSGLSECGVMRYAVTNVELEHNVNSEQPNLLAVTHPNGTYFPFTNYMNIWLVGEICETTGASACNGTPSTPPGIVGYATFPGAPLLGLDGIVIRSDAFGDNTPSGNNYPLLTSPHLQQGKILAHEVGHYLTLYHTHEQTPLACSGNTLATCATDGDRCCDTPATTTLNYLCPGAIPNSCVDPSPNPVDQIENYMSYSDDNCMNTFTNCQSQRMAATLTGPRSVLVSATNLNNTGTISGSGTCLCNALVANISVTPASPCPGVNVCFSTTGGTGVTSWSWNFGDLASGPLNTSTLQNPCHVFASAGTYLVTLTVTNALGQTYTATTNVQVAAPTATITGPTTAPTVCDASQQCVTIQFTGTKPWTATLTDGSSNYTVVSNQAIICWPVTVKPGFPVYTLTSLVDGQSCTGPFSGSAQFNIIACCPEQFLNGDFSAGTGCNIAPFTTQHVTTSGSPPCGWFNPDRYAVYNISTSSYGSWPLNANLPNIGNGVIFDGYGTAVNTSPSPPHTDLLCQTVSLLPSMNYMLSFWVTQTDLSTMLRLQVKVAGAFVGTAITVPTAPASPPGSNWVPFNIQFNSGAGGTVPICLCQVTNFNQGGYDYLLDNLSLRRIGPCNTPQPCPPPLPPVIPIPTDRRCGTTNSGFHHSIDIVGQTTSVAGYVTVGERRLSSGARGLHVIRWDRFGSVVQERLFSVSSPIPGEHIVGTSVDVDANCDVLVAGEISGGVTPALFAAKLSPNLVPVWAKRLTGDVTNGPRVQADWLSDGSAAIIGMGLNTAGNPNLGRAIRLNNAGNPLWSMIYTPFGIGAFDRFAFYDLEQAPDGVIWVCGGYSGFGSGSAMIMPIDLATGFPVALSATLYPNAPTGGIDFTVFTAVKLDSTPGANLGDLLLAGYVGTTSFPNFFNVARAARINRAVMAPADWDRLYNFNLVPGQSAIGLRRPVHTSAPTDILIAGANASGHLARTLEIRESDGFPINAKTHANSAPPYTTFRDITPGADQTMIGHIETTAGAGPQILFGQNGCPVSVFPTHSNGQAEPQPLVEVFPTEVPNSNLTLVEEPVGTACVIQCRFNSIRGDMDCNGSVSMAEMDGFVIALLDPAVYASEYPLCDIINADINMDGYVDGLDIDSYVRLLTGS